MFERKEERILALKIGMKNADIEKTYAKDHPEIFKKVDASIFYIEEL